jgi:hypothetical protein
LIVFRKDIAANATALKLLMCITVDSVVHCYSIHLTTQLSITPVIKRVISSPNSQRGHTPDGCREFAIGPADAFTLFTSYEQNKTGAEDVGNSTSSAPAA